MTTAINQYIDRLQVIYDREFQLYLNDPRPELRPIRCELCFLWSKAKKCVPHANQVENARKRPHLLQTCPYLDHAGFDAQRVYNMAHNFTVNWKRQKPMGTPLPVSHLLHFSCDACKLTPLCSKTKKVIHSVLRCNVLEDERPQNWRIHFEQDNFPPFTAFCLAFCCPSFLPP